MILTLGELIALILGSFIVGAVAGLFLGCYLSHVDEHPPRPWPNERHWLDD